MKLRSIPFDHQYSQNKSARIEWFRLAALLAVIALGSLVAQAQSTNEVELLKQQMRDMQERFEQVQREQRQQIEALTRRLDQLSKPPSTPTPPDPEKEKLARDLAAELAKDQPSPSTPGGIEPSSSPLTQPLTLARAGSAYLNLSFDTLVDAGWSTAAEPSDYLELGDHDPLNRGFSLRNAEIALDGAVDPYFKGFANIAFKLDKDNETSLELEEAYLVSSSLPANLQLKAGQFFANFGRQNPQHPHQWAFVDQPLILNRAFGPDGLRNVGAQISWLAPTPFYTEASLGILNGQGGTAFNFRNPGEPDAEGVLRQHGRATLDRTLRGPGDLLYVPRLASSFDLTDQQTLLVGASAALGPNDTAESARTGAYGLDLYWKWKPANAQAGFPFVSWQTEALYQRFDAGADPAAPIPLPAETLQDWGFYSQVQWGFRPRWVAGLRGEYAHGNRGLNDPSDVFRGQRTRVSPALTFYPSEFSKIRLHYNFDEGDFFGTDHSVWLQFEFLLGAHGAHRF